MRKVLIKPTMTPAKATVRYKQIKASSRASACLTIYTIHCLESQSGALLVVFSKLFLSKEDSWGGAPEWNPHSPLRNLFWGWLWVRVSSSQTWEHLDRDKCCCAFAVSEVTFQVMVYKRDRFVELSFFEIPCSWAAAKRGSWNTEGLKRTVTPFLAQRKERGEKKRLSL